MFATTLFVPSHSLYYTTHMTITWHGLYTVKIVTPQLTLVLDPHAKTSEFPAYRSKANLVALSSPSTAEMSCLEGIQGDPPVINTPGEYSIAGVTLYGIGWHDANGREHSLQRWHIENMIIVHLGALDHKLADTELQQLEQTDIDILLLPIDSQGQWSLREALATLTVLEPRLVMPINFTSSKDFAKQMGVLHSTAQPKLSISRHKLPAEGVETIILQA